MSRAFCTALEATEAVAAKEASAAWSAAATSTAPTVSVPLFPLAARRVSVEVAPSVTVSCFDTGPLGAAAKGVPAAERAWAGTTCVPSGAAMVAVVGSTGGQA